MLCIFLSVSVSSQCVCLRMCVTVCYTWRWRKKIFKLVKGDGTIGLEINEMDIDWWWKSLNGIGFERVYIPYYSRWKIIKPRIEKMVLFQPLNEKDKRTTEKKNVEWKWMNSNLNATWFLKKLFESSRGKGEDNLVQYVCCAKEHYCSSIWDFSSANPSPRLPLSLPHSQYQTTFSFSVNVICIFLLNFVCFLLAVTINNPTSQLRWFYFHD